MSKFSVKKPLTVFVAVIAILVLGVVAYFRMTPDLLPNMDFPYVLIMTTYPGASPEKVEQEITRPMEQAMSTLDHIQEVTSVSSENVGMVVLEFTEGVNMDTVGVDIQQEISQLSADWSDTVGTPYVLKINPSMLPVEVAAVSMEGMDTVELTEFLDETLMNKLEGVPGVARITTSGEIEQELHVVLDQKRIDKLNDRIAAAINGELDDAAAELNRNGKSLAQPSHQLRVGRNALKRAVEIDEVQEFRALLLPLQRRRHRIVGKDRGVVGPAAPQTHGLAPLNVHRGEKDHNPNSLIILSMPSCASSSVVTHLAPRLMKVLKFMRLSLRPTCFSLKCERATSAPPGSRVSIR